MFLGNNKNIRERDGEKTMKERIRKIYAEKHEHDVHISFDENFNQPPFIGELGDVGNVPLQISSPQILSQNIFNRINEVKEFRDNENYTEALAVLDDIKVMNDAGTLNDLEQIVMWEFYANIAQLEGNYDNTIVAFNQILRIESLSVHNRALAKRYLDSLNDLPESPQ